MIWPPCMYTIFQMSVCQDTISCFSLYLYVLPISPIWFPFEVGIPSCSETFISALNVTPKTFSCVVLPSAASPILYSLSVFPCPVCMHLHVQKLNNICYFSDYLTNLSRSSWQFFICIIFNLFEYFCVICKCQYFATYMYVIFQIIYIY